MTDTLSTISFDRLRAVIDRAQSDRLNEERDTWAAARDFLARPIRGHGRRPRRPTYWPTNVVAFDGSTN